ncbi:hypothetical protein ACFPIF_00015 [Brevundimonas faecalis]|uniref:hypothetical protein n=1 Tax=Brevundimonas faecalis TaxID=947378 RepID=UPI00360A112D
MKGQGFRVVCEQEGGVWVRFRTLTCRCGAEGRIKDTGKRLLASSPVADAFRRLGWTSVKPDRGVCPVCSAPKPKPAPAPKEIVMAVEPPRQPTTADRRRIRDALLDHYDEDGGFYRGEQSDRTLGETLNVPFAWVSSMRDAMGLGADKSEASQAYTAEVMAMKEELRRLQDEFLAAFAKRCDDLERRISAAERRGYRSAA